MESITLFAKKLVVIVIIISAILNLTTGDKYDKYLRFVVGLMLVFYTMSAIMGFAIDLTIQDFDTISAVNGSDVFLETEQNRNEMIDEAVLNSYSSSILYSLQTSGYDVKRVVCTYENETIAVTYYTVSSNNLAGIKKYINDFYHIESSHIYGYTEAEDE